MQLTSANFSAGGTIPTRFTCEGENISPQFSWEEVPGDAKSFALIMHDPDAPRPGGFTHWVLYNIPGKKRGLDSDVPKREQIPGTGVQGQNDAGEIGYMGPCPPSGRHRYYVRLFALDKEMSLGPGATHEELTDVMEGHILERAELMGTYSKKADKVA